MTRRVLCALLVVCGASLLSAFAATDTNSGQWLIDFQNDGQIQLTLHQEHHEHSFPVPAESFHGLARNATHFEFVRDAGTFACDGRFAGDHGAGIFVFAAHFSERRVSFGHGRVPVNALPFRAHQLAERVPRGKADSDSVGRWALAQGPAQIVGCGDSVHSDSGVA